MGSLTRSRGVTLVELVVTIVVVAVAAAAVLAVLSAVAARSADEMTRQQSVLIAESYLHEALEKPFGAADCAPCLRKSMDTVGDYNGLADSGVHDQNGNAASNLTGYTVGVSATFSALGSIPAAARQAQLVTVTVTAPTGAQVVLSGYRTLYP
jgi:MSHA pilin protein MshD